MNSELFIQELIEETRKIINKVEKLNNYDLQLLMWKQNSNSWSILQCIEHLNLYGDFYLPQIEHKIKESSTTNDLYFKSGILGSYFSKSMLPKEKLNKMKTFKDKNPINVKLDKQVLDKFINQQIKFVELLILSRNVSLNKVKIKTSISSLIKLKLGDTFQFLINHNIRHFNQIDKIKLVKS